MNNLTIQKNQRILKGDIVLPASKSISNRALVLRFLSGKKTELNNLSESDDTKLLLSLLEIIDKNTNPASIIELNCGNAGTVLRFLTALLAITPGKWLLTGSERMKERPIGILVNGLRILGAEIDYRGKTGFPPILVLGKSLKGGELEIDGSVSSQFITAMLLIAPTLKKGLRLVLKNKTSSFAYIEMTLKLLNHFGIKSSLRDNIIYIQQQEFIDRKLTIEPDWTSASYWFELVAFSKKADVVLSGLKNDSFQGDSVLPDIYSNFGVQTEFLSDGLRLTKSESLVHEFNFDFSNHPDLAPAVIVTCAGLNIPARFTGLESLRIKETDRITALQNEFGKLGFNIRVFGNSELRTQNSFIRPSFSAGGEPKTLDKEPIKTYGDHRMAMAFAPLAIIFGTIQIENSEVVSKSYPGYWKDIKKVGLTFNDQKS